MALPKTLYLHYSQLPLLSSIISIISAVESVSLCFFFVLVWASSLFNNDAELSIYVQY